MVEWKKGAVIHYALRCLPGFIPRSARSRSGKPDNLSTQGPTTDPETVNQLQIILSLSGISATDSIPSLALVQEVMAVLSGFTRSPKPTPCNSFASGYSSRCKLQKIRSRRSLVQLVQITCVSLQAYRHSSRSTSILSYRAAALACPACLLACPALACTLAAGLASALAFVHGLRWQS